MRKGLDIKGHNFKWIIYAIDIIIILVVFFVFVHVIVPAGNYYQYNSSSRFYWNRFGHAFLFLLSYLCSVSAIRIKNTDLDSRLETTFRAGAQVVLMYIIFVIIGALLFHTFSARLIAWTGIANGMLIILSHNLVTNTIVNSRRRPENVIKTVFVGADQNNVLLYEKIKSGFGTFGYNILGFFSESEPVPAGVDYLGRISDVLEFLESNDADEVYCSVSPVEKKDAVNAIIRKCEEKFITFYYVPNMDGYLRRQMQFNQFCDITIVSVRKEPLNDVYNRGFKRFGDILLSGLFLIALYPVVWLVVSIGTKLSSPGPILFRQKRTGYNGKTFTMLKFRSMKVNSDADKVQATEDDPRKTRFGDFLRRTSIDELPQFINVFKGDMSVVGPRPHMELHTEMYSKLVDEYLVRHLCKPGITGWAQVSGSRGETKTVEEMAERVKKDIWYIENWSLLLDLRIIVKTILNIFSGDKQAY